MAETAGNDKAGARLESWKEIAAYLQRDVSTVRRWEKLEGLPVHRHEHRQRSSVYAIPAELDAWRVGRQPEPEAAPAPPVARRLAIAAAVVAILLASGWALWRTGVLRLPYPLVEAAAPGAGKPVARQLWASKANELFMSPPSSTDGRLAVLSLFATGDLAAIELATGKQRRLTTEGERASSSDFALFPVISPDGRFVAYSWWSAKKELYELRVRGTAAGSEARTLSSELPDLFAAGWSGDGKQLLVAGDGRIGLLAVDSGALRVVKSYGRRGPAMGGSMSLSPDGRYIAYDSPQAEEGPERDIFLLSSDGSRDVPLVRHPGHDAGPMWTPDGSRMLFFSDRSGALGLWSVSVAEGRAQGAPALIQANAGHMSPLGFSRKGGLYYSVPSGADDLLVAEMDLETGGSSLSLWPWFLATGDRGGAPTGHRTAATSPT